MGNTNNLLIKVQLYFLELENSYLIFMYYGSHFKSTIAFCRVLPIYITSKLKTDFKRKKMIYLNMILKFRFTNYVL